MKILIRISYLGTDYCGYQVQPNGISIQQRLNEATLAVFGYPCDIVGCSRTDSGVHANMFCATVTRRGSETLDTAITIDRIPQALSANLPHDIVVYGAEWVSDDFHARYDVIEKEYIYRYYNRALRDPFEEGRSAHVPKQITDEGLEKMRIAAATLCGTKDFSTYMAKGSSVKSTVRTVTRAEVTRTGDVIEFRVAANGFLYNMVRILAGTLLLVAQERMTVAEFVEVTESQDRARAGATMPACGLYLNRVVY